MELDLNEVAKRSIVDAPGFEDAYKLARKLSGNGKLYAIGGIVYRTLVRELYGKEFVLKDIDILSVNPLDLNADYSGFSLGKNSFGKPKFSKNGLVIDILPIREYEYIQKNGHDPIIGNYLTGCPLNIQSVAYDLEEECLLGPECFKAIEDRIVRINNRETLRRYCQKKGISLPLYMLSIARKLGFDVEIEQR